MVQYETLKSNSPDHLGLCARGYRLTAAEQTAAERPEAAVARQAAEAVLAAERAAAGHRSEAGAVRGVAELEVQVKQQAAMLADRYM